MIADEPPLDTEQLPIPTEGRNVTHARASSADLLGRRVVMEENPGIVSLPNTWVIMNQGGRPTPGWRGRWAHLLTALLDRCTEIRCYMRHPDGDLTEVGQATGLVEGWVAEQPSAGRAAGRADGR
jgi:hypothetical protein